MTNSKVIKAKSLKVTFKDGSVLVDNLTDKVLERHGEDYAVFNTTRAGCFTYAVGKCNIVKIEVQN